MSVADFISVPLNASITRFFCSALLLLASLSAGAEVLRLSDIPPHSLGRYAYYLIEGEVALGVDEAMARQRAGGFEPETKTAPDFGIGSNPVWLHLVIENDTGKSEERYFVGGMTWLDRVDVFLLHADGSRREIHSGDELPDAPGLTPGMGYAFPLNFPAGQSELFLRVASVDPMAIPIELLLHGHFDQRRLQFGYYYGFFFGFLLALGIYNLLLFAGTRERSYLYYSLALLSILFCNLSYTGHGAGWLWPQSPGFQRYVILVSMVVYNVMGLLFASRFLMLAKHLPRTQRVVCWSMGLAVGGMLLALWHVGRGAHRAFRMGQDPVQFIYFPCRRDWTGDRGDLAGTGFGALDASAPRGALSGGTGGAAGCADAVEQPARIPGSGASAA